MVVGQRRGNSHDQREKVGLTVPVTRCGVQWERSYGVRLHVEFCVRYRYRQRQSFGDCIRICIAPVWEQQILP